MATFNDYLAKIQTNAYKTKAKIELLRRVDETPYSTIEGDIIGGNITINRKNGTRRTCSVVLNNYDGAYIPDEYLFWINSKFKLSIGVLCDDGEYYYVPMGIFVTQNPLMDVGIGRTDTITISGTDKFSLLSGLNSGILGATYIISLGTNIPTAIRTILTTFNDTINPIIHSTYTSEVTPYTITEAYGKTSQNLLFQLQGMLSSNIYYDANGQLVFEPDFNDAGKASEWDFEKGDFHYIGARYEPDYSSVKNKILVIGDNINGAIYDAVAENTNLQSPTRTQLIGEKLEIIEDSNIYTTALAQDRADYELKRKIAVYSGVSIESAIIFHLDVDKVITLTEDKLKFDKERFLIENINIPLGNSASRMTIDVVKTSDLVLG